MLYAAFVTVLVFGSGLIPYQQSEGFRSLRLSNHLYENRYNKGFMTSPKRSCFGHGLDCQMKKSEHLNQLFKGPDRDHRISSGILAEAAQKSYRPSDFSGFQPVKSVEDRGVRLSVFKKSSTKQVIIAFPGTQTRQELITDLAMIASDDQINPLLDRALTDLGIIEKIFFESILRVFKRKADPQFINFSADTKNRDHRVMARVEEFKEKFLNPEMIAKKFLQPKLKVIEEQVSRILKENAENQVYVTGHSLGGVYAQLTSGIFGLSGCSFNAPGLSPGFDLCEERSLQRNSNTDFINFRETYDLVSRFRLLRHHGAVETIDLGDMNPIVAHDLIRMVPYFKQIDASEG